MKGGIAAIAVGTLLLVGCVNPYVNNFRYEPGVTPTLVAARRAGPPPPTPEVIEGANPKTDLLNQEADGYMPIGYADFSAAPGFVPRDGAIKEGEAIGADRVLVYSHYQGTVTTAIPMTTPTRQTTYYNGSATAYGSNGGVATATDTGTATTYGSETHYMPLSIQRYEFLAVYLVKAKMLFGATYQAVTQLEAQEVGTVDAVHLSVIVRGTPAAAAGLLPGDIVTGVDGEAIAGARDFTSKLRADAGRSAILTIVRNGQTLEKLVALPRE
jgi:hypothetical protein